MRVYLGADRCHMAFPGLALYLELVLIVAYLVRLLAGLKLFARAGLVLSLEDVVYLFLDEVVLSILNQGRTKSELQFVLCPRLL